MKRLIILFLLPLTLCLQSCVVSEAIFCAINNEEIIQFDSSGNGVYSMRLDFHDFIRMAGPEQLVDYKSLKLDTTVLFSSMLEKNSPALTGKEELMFKNGSATINCNITDGREVLFIKLFFSTPDQLNFAREHIFNFVSRNSEYAFSLFMPKTDLDLDSISKELLKQLGVTEPRLNFKVESPDEYNISNEVLEIKGFNPVGKAFSLSVTQDSIQNNLTNLSLFEKTISSNKSLQGMKSEHQVLDKVIFKTTFIVPKEIKNYKGSMESISPDKKTITFKSSLSTILSKPKETEFFVSF